MKIPGLFITLFAALLGLASCSAPGRSGDSAEYEIVTLTAELVPDKGPDCVYLTLRATIRNNSREPITFTNLGFGGVLLTGSDARLLMPPAVSLPMTLTTQPGGRYEQQFQLYPSFLREETGLRPGRYRMRVRYRRPGAPFLPPTTVEREPNVIKDGVVLSLDSANFDVVIK